jgi:hypothetical protein
MGDARNMVEKFFEEAGQTEAKGRERRWRQIHRWVQNDARLGLSPFLR